MSQFQRPPFQPQQPPYQSQQPHTGYPQWQQPPQQSWYPPPPQMYEYPQQQAPLPPPTPPPMPPRKHRERKEIMIAVSILLILVIGFSVFGLILASQPSNNKTGAAPIPTATPLPTDTPTPMQSPMPAPTEAPTQPPTPTPTPNPHGDVGVSQTSDFWIVTVNSISTNPGDDIDVPKSSDVYLLVNITAENNDTTNRLIADNEFTFQDQQGTTYQSTILATDQHIFVGGNVVAGQKLRGDLVYEIPKSLHSFTLQFDPEFDPSLIVQWNLTD